MKHQIRFPGGPEDVCVTTSGSVSVDGLDAVVYSLLADTRYVPGLAVLFDHRELDWTELYAEDLVRRLHVALKQADLLGPRRIAVVADDPRLDDASPVRLDEPRWAGFRTLDDARTWLEAERGLAA
jgi:hypothetical protein